MKIELYFDAYPGMNPNHVNVFQASSATLFTKWEHSIRYKVVVEIPDLAKPDQVIQGVATETT